jgi:hypothetical protein
VCRSDGFQANNGEEGEDQVRPGHGDIIAVIRRQSDGWPASTKDPLHRVRTCRNIAPDCDPYRHVFDLG